MFDSGSNTHVINYYERFTNVRVASEIAILNGEKDIY